MDDVITIFMHAQQDSPEAMKEILAKFNPLIQKECKYEYGLNKEDCIDELIFFVLKFVKTIDLKKFKTDPQLIAYFEKSIKHEGARFFRKKTKILKHEKLIGDDEIVKQLSLDFSPSCDDNMVIKSYVQNILNKKEGQVIYLHYIMDYSIADIAKIFGISRQAVNKEKNKAIKKIFKDLNIEVYKN